MSKLKLRDKKVIIFGGTGSLGKEIINLLDDEDANLIIVSRNIDKLKVISKNLKNKHIFVECDVTDYNYLKDSLEKLDISEVSYSLNLVGGYSDISIDKYDESKLKQILLNTVLSLTNPTNIVKDSLKNNNGKLIYISSSSLNNVSKKNTGYQISKKSAEIWLEGLNHYFSESNAEAVTLRINQIVDEETEKKGVTAKNLSKEIIKIMKNEKNIKKIIEVKNGD